MTATLSLSDIAELANVERPAVSMWRKRPKGTRREDVQAKLRSAIKRLLRKYKYPPDKQPAAVKLVLEQMEALAPGYADDRSQR